MPRVLHLNPINNLAGVCRSMNTLMQELVKQEPTYAVTFFENEVAELCRDSGAEVHTIFGEKRMPSSAVLRIWKATRVLSRAIKDWNIDLIHVHSARGMRYAWLAAKLHGLPVICHQRDNYAKDRFHYGLGSADHIISISAWVDRGLTPQIRRKSSTIYNAVHLPDESAITKRFDNQSLVIGYAGRCFHDKGIDILLDAAEILAERKDFRLVLVGIPELSQDTDNDHKDAPKAEDRVNQYAVDIRSRISELPSDLKKRISVEPFRKQISDFYQEVDIVVVPSRYPEPLGRMAIEAMAWKCVTVVANHGGLSEIVEHGKTGLVFEPCSGHSLAKQLNQLLDSRSVCRQLAEAGHIDVSKRFSPEAHAIEVRKVYDKVLQEKACST